MELWSEIRGKLYEIFREVPPTSIESVTVEEMYSCVSEDQMLAPRFKAPSSPAGDPVVTAATTERTSLAGLEEAGSPTFPVQTIETAYQVRNLTTGETLDLRDENDPDFPQKYALLTLSKDPEGYL